MCTLCRYDLFSVENIDINIFVLCPNINNSLLHFTHIAFIHVCTEYSVQIFSVAFLSTFPQLLCLQSELPGGGGGIAQLGRGSHGADICPGGTKVH